MLPLHHGPVERTTRIERASPDWHSGALPSELRPRREPFGLISGGTAMIQKGEEKGRKGP
jgi:hypothetical protein